MTRLTVVLDAAKRLGMKPEEITNVEDSPAGTIITTFDGTRLIDVPVDTPDADGQTGLMFLTAPSESYGGTFPVFAQEPEQATGTDGDDPAPGDEYPQAGTIADVLAWVAGDVEKAQLALDAENARHEPRSTLVPELEAMLEQATGTDGDAPAPGDEDEA